MYTNVDKYEFNESLLGNRIRKSLLLYNSMIRQKARKGWKTFNQIKSDLKKQ